MTPEQIQGKYKIIAEFLNSYDASMFKDPTRAEECKKWLEGLVNIAYKNMYEISQTKSNPGSLAQYVGMISFELINKEKIQEVIAFVNEYNSVDIGLSSELKNALEFLTPKEY